VLPDDLVNDAYIELFDKNVPYSFNDATKIIARSAFKEKDATYSGIIAKSRMHDCQKCGESKPVNGFYFILKNGQLLPRNICINCYIKKQLDYYNKNKEQLLIKAADYKQANKEKIRLKKQEYYLKNKRKIVETSL